MTRIYLLRAILAAAAALLIGSLGCSDDTKAAPTKAELVLDPNLYTVEHPDLFKLATVETRNLPTVLTANGSVTPEVNRTIHVTSQAAGRVVDLRAKLGDYVKKDQVLLSIYSADLTAALSDYQKALADERLTKKALDRQQLLLSHGAAAQKDLEQAEDSEEKAKLDVTSAEHRVRILGGDPTKSSSTIELRAPVAGTIVEQNVAGFEGIKSLDNSPTLFTIADLSEIWVVCDVYENDLGEVHVGDAAEIRLNAFPDKLFHGNITDISRVLDPNTRSAKVRIALPNRNGDLRPGMFAVATFRSRKETSRLVVPTTATLRLQDKDWVFRKEGKHFRRLEAQVAGGASDGYEQVDCALKPGDQIVANALEFSTAAAELGK